MLILARTVLCLACATKELACTVQPAYKHTLGGRPKGMLIRGYACKEGHVNSNKKATPLNTPYTLAPHTSLAAREKKSWIVASFTLACPHPAHTLPSPPITPSAPPT